ncbi:hypothetical protein B7P43_G09473 [Cryptotermes secundus]|uniref:MADF domain-containing protein n=1 Tax=Cryptotermes secundus TaxID=105785 RepID=A0A2J7R2M5_9NEOP|nr:uncharacterized protein LOC111863762 [Cryptotermes secundus]PNF35081.1 hypothetical protein B7P43_G09473 [Cryptotermes secundus]
MARWNDETVMKFVKLYEAEVCLWPTSDSDYKNKTARNQSLKNIVGAMDLKGFGVPECKQKIKNIRSHYCQELTKIRSSKISGSGPDSVHEPTLVWFKTLDAFLRPFTAQAAQCKPGKFVKIGVTTHNFLSANRREKQDGISPKNMFYADSQRDTLKDTLHQQCSVPKRPKVEDIVGLISVEDGISKLQNLLKLEDPSEFDLWARSVAVQLNKMDVQRALQLQLKLQAIITEERIKYETRSHHEDVYQQYPWLKVISSLGSHMETNQSVIPSPSTTADTQLSSVSCPEYDIAVVGKKDSFVL